MPIAGATVEKLAQAILSLDQLDDIGQLTDLLKA
jgi:hypothetical protein